LALLLVVAAIVGVPLLLFLGLADWLSLHPHEAFYVHTRYR